MKGSLPVAAARPLNVHTSVAAPGTCNQKEPLLNVQTQQEEFEFGMISIPQHQQSLTRDMTVRRWTAPQRSFSQQSSTVTTSKKQENVIYIHSNPGIGKTTTVNAESLIGKFQNEDTVYTCGMTTPVQHLGQTDLGGKTTTTALKQSMLTSASQGKEKPLLSYM